MNSRSARRHVASFVALLLLLQGLVGATALAPAAASVGLEICRGDGTIGLVPASDEAPSAPEGSHCVLCLLPASLPATEPADIPLPAERTLARTPLVEVRGEMPVRARSSWPRAPPRS